MPRIPLVLLIALAIASAKPGDLPSRGPGATPEAPDAAWRVAGHREVDAGSRLTALSPDGRWLAGADETNRFCLWDIATLAPRCVDEQLVIRLETIRWSPDGTAVAFTLDAVMRFHESDIYVYELAAGELVNLTDDGFEGDIIEAEDAGVPVDDVPAWSPDSRQIAFARSLAGAEGRSTALMRIDRTGGEPVEIHRVAVPEVYLVRTPMYWLHGDTLLFTLLAFDPLDDDNGVWAVGIGGSGARLVLDGAEDADVPAPAITDVSGDGAIAFVYSDALAGEVGVPLDQVLFWVLDLGSGEIAPLLPSPETPGEPPPRVIAAGLSPDGAHALAWIVGPDGYRLTLVDMATRGEHPVELPPVDTEFLPVAPQWAADGTVLLQGRTGQVLLAFEPAA
jgi:hypothetical protein